MLESLVHCDVTAISEPIRVVVVNNYPPAATEVSDIVLPFKSYAQFDWQILYREQTLDPVENWYSAIAAYASVDEVVFIHSDDDIFLPWSLESRYSQVTQLSGDMLLAGLGPTAFFLDDAARIMCCEPLSQPIRVDARILEASDVERFAPQHISNHCYRYTATFQRALAQGMAWCNALTWLDTNTRTLFLPLYLPFAVMLQGGCVLGLDVPCTVRGQDIGEVQRAPFGVANWNPGFVHLPAWHILRNADLGPLRTLDEMRDGYVNMFVEWFPTYFLDKRVGWRKVVAGMRNTAFPWRRLFSLRIAHGFRLLLGECLHLRTRRTSRKSPQVKPVGDFLKSLQQLGST